MRAPAARRLARFLVVATVALFADGCRNRNPTGELQPPRGAPEWENRYAVAFDDAYTREPINLSGRAPNDVLDQRLFAARLGHAHVVALVTVDQVWGRGRYQSDQNQYLDVAFEKTLMGELPKDTDEEQLLRISGEDELPGSLQGQTMVLFVRWAPDERPAYHHHLMPADEEIVTYIDAMVQHAQDEGVLDDDGSRSKRKRRKKSKRKRERAEERAETKAEVSTKE